MRNTILKWLTLVVLLVYAALASVWACRIASQQRCAGIDIEILKTPGVPEYITESGVLKELATFTNKWQNRRISDISTEKIERTLSSNNNFEDVECIRTSDNRLLVRITPMIPEIRIFSHSDSYYINKDGKRINATPDFFVNVPVVKGEFNKKFPASSILGLTRAIAADSMMKNLVTMVNVESPENIILIPRIRGHIINIGDTTHLAEKFRNIALMYHEVMPYRGWQTYDTISVKFAGQIVATRRDKGPIQHSTVIDDGSDLIEEASLQGQQIIVTGRETEADVATTNNQSTTI